MTSIVITEQDNVVAIAREVVVTENVAQMCYDAMLALGHAPINVAEAFATIGDNNIEVLMREYKDENYS